MAIGTILGGEIGRAESKSDRSKSKQYLKDTRNYIRDGVVVPDAKDMEADFYRYDPAAMEGTFNIGGTSYDQIALDPATRNAQMQALARLQNISEQGGMDSIDRARMADIMGDTYTKARGAREAIQQNMRARGIAGSGLEMVQQQMANQAAAEQANRGGLQTAAMAQQRALEAIQGSANLGGQIRGQDYGMQADRARAMDAINSFNAQNSQNVANRNTTRVNDRNIANTDLANKNILYNKGQTQQQYQNQLAKAGAFGAANQGLSNYHAGNAAQTQQLRTGQGRASDEAFYNAADMVSSFYGGGLNKKVDSV
jgi:hypothetical protein